MPGKVCLSFVNWFIFLILMWSGAFPACSQDIPTVTPTPTATSTPRVDQTDVHIIEISDPEYFFDTYNEWYPANWGASRCEYEGLIVTLPDYDSYVWGSAYYQCDINRFILDHYGLEPNQYVIEDAEMVLSYALEHIGKNLFSTLFIHQPLDEWDACSLTTNNMPESSALFSFVPVYEGHALIRDPDFTAIMNDYRQAGLDSSEWKRGFAIRPGRVCCGPYPGTDIIYLSMETAIEENRPKLRLAIRTLEPGVELPTPTPRPTLPLDLELNGGLNAFISSPPAYRQGRVEISSIPSAQGSDETGMKISLSPGQGVWTLFPQVVNAGSLIQLNASVRATNPQMSVALVALNYPLEEQLAYTNITDAELPSDRYRMLKLLYRPPSGQMQVAVQAVNPHFSAFSGTVYIDNIQAKPARPIDIPSEETELEVHGSFDQGIAQLYMNMNEVDGDVSPVFEAFSDVAINLSVTDGAFAANLGTTVMRVENRFPFTLLGEVNVKRLTPPQGGLFAFVMTNGYQNIGQFRYVDTLPGFEDEYETVRLGGDFTIRNNRTPIFVIVQNSSPNARSSVRVDDLSIKIK